MEENDTKKRRCIGVLIPKADRSYQRAVLCGIYKAAFERDMNVAVFTSTLSGGLASEQEPELDIFTLANYDKLAGVIYVPVAFDYKHTDEVINKPLVDAVKNKGLHAVTIGTGPEGIPSVIYDDLSAITAMVNHLVNDHGCTDIGFMTGTKGNPYSDMRLNDYIKIMESKGLTVHPDRLYYGDFWYNEGENFVKQLMNSEHGMPQAIIAISCHMACSVYKALLKYGYKVPDDVILTCYTDEPDIYRFISSSSKRAEEEGYYACTKLLNMIEGKGEAVGEYGIKIEFDLNKSVTCGCKKISEFDLSVGDGIDINMPMSYFSEYNYITMDLLCRNGYREMFWALDWYTTYIKGIHGIYFCMCDGWNTPCNEELFLDEDEENPEQAPIHRGYTKQVQPYYYRINNDDGTHDSHFEGTEFFDSSEMLPQLFSAEGPPSSFIFRSLHFADRNFGYIVLDNADKMQTYDITFDYWLRDIANVMEYQRKLNNEKYLYSSDFMTGLINRNGFNRMIPGIINEAKRGGFQLFFTVCDMNGLKFINDTYGHVEGDNGIKIAAQALVDANFPQFAVERNFRIGGDEFVKAVIGNFTDEEVLAFRNKIYDTLEAYNKTSGKPYPVYMSIGAIVKNPDEEYTPDSLISEADKLMFADKQRIKQETGFNPFRK